MAVPDKPKTGITTIGVCVPTTLVWSRPAGIVGIVGDGVTVAVGVKVNVMLAVTVELGVIVRVGNTAVRVGVTVFVHVNSPVGVNGMTVPVKVAGAIVVPVCVGHGVNVLVGICVMFAAWVMVGGGTFGSGLLHCAIHIDRNAHATITPSPNTAVRMSFPCRRNHVTNLSQYSVRCALIDSII
jgi:hypothetical protein